MSAQATMFLVLAASVGLWMGWTVTRVEAELRRETERLRGENARLRAECQRLRRGIAAEPFLTSPVEVVVKEYRHRPGGPR